MKQHTWFLSDIDLNKSLNKYSCEHLWWHRKSFLAMGKKNNAEFL